MDQSDDPIFTDASRVNGSSMTGSTDSSGGAEQAARQPDANGVRPGFLSELANAMRATAQRERETIAARVAEDAGVHIEKVKARAAIETEELRRLAEEDVQHIEEWSASEMERIRVEAEQKITDRRASLDDYLQQHDQIIETEIEGVDAAVAEYGSTLDRFFAELAEAADPSAIVARAENLPAPPDLDQIRAQARAKAVAMFAEPDTAAAPEAVAAPEAAVVPDVAVDMTPIEAQAEPVAEAAAVEAEPTPVTGSIGGDTAEATEFVAPSVDADASNGEGVAETIAETQPAAEAPLATAETAPVEPQTESTPSPEPVPVMDPAATADQAWPAPEPESEQPATIAPSVDNTSAAVRLLRSVAPWTAPTHAGSGTESRPESE